MGKISPKRRKLMIRIKQKRKRKLAKLRQRWCHAQTKEEKEKILAKVQRLAPWLSQEEFLAPLKERQE